MYRGNESKQAIPCQCRKLICPAAGLGRRVYEACMGACISLELGGPAVQVDDMVMVMDEGLRVEACGIVAKLRAAGRAVDLVLEPKKMKWAFKQAER